MFFKSKAFKRVFFMKPTVHSFKSVIQSSRFISEIFLTEHKLEGVYSRIYKFRIQTVFNYISQFVSYYIFKLFRSIFLRAFCYYRKYSVHSRRIEPAFRIRTKSAFNKSLSDRRRICIHKYI